jgi:putative ABC transport system permease protein
MKRLSAVSYRGFRRGGGRYTLTAVGIALGVAIVFGILITNDTTARALRNRIGTETAPTVLVQPIGSYSADLPMSLTDKYAPLDGVDTSVGGLGTWIPMPGRPKGSDEQLYLYSVRWLTGPAHRQQKGGSSVGRNPASGADEIRIGAWLADKLHLRLGATIELPATGGPRRFTVVQIETSEVDRQQEDRSALTSMQTMRAILGKGEVVQWLNVTLAKSLKEAQWIAAHQDAFEGVRAVPSAETQWRRNLRQISRFGNASFAGAAAVSIFVGGFLIFLTLSMAVEERMRTYGTMRALGASPRQIRRVVLGEAAALGVLSSLAGLVIGVVVAAGLVAISAALFDIPRPGMLIRPLPVAIASVTGIAVTLAGALLPAARAARLDPIAAIRGSQSTERASRRGWTAGLVIALAGLAVTIATNAGRMHPGRTSIVFAWLPGFAMLLGAVLLTPLVMRPVAHAAGRLTVRFSRAVGDVGVMHLVKERTRSAYTLALVMAVLALVFSIRAAEVSWERTADRALTQAFPADIGVASQGSRLTDGDLASVRAAPGVQAVSEVRFGATEVLSPSRADTNLIFIDPRTYFSVQSLPWIHGSDDDARKRLGAGGWMLVPESYADRYSLRIGSRVVVKTSAGTKPFRVGGVYESLASADTPWLITGAADGAGLFNLGAADALALRVAPGGNARRIAAGLRKAFAGRPGVIVNVTQDQRAASLRGFIGYIRILYAIVMVAGVIGMLGLANTMAISVLRRTREIGVLRAVGTGRRQLRGMVFVESATLALVALALSVPLGWLLSVSLIRGAGDATGAIYRYVYPWTSIPALGAIALVIAVLAALAPARRAARVDPVTALRFE